MSTFDVLRRAAKAGKNLVITHEPTFYNDRDVTTALEADPVYLAKQRFIAEHNLVVWRFHDHAHRDAARSARSPDRRARSAGRSMPRRPTRASTSCRRPRSASSPSAIARRLGDRAIRVVGDPAMKVSRVVLGPGYGMPALTAAADVVVGGEIGESGGNTEYALDAAAAGQPKAMIMLGHMMSEDHGMQEVADWLRTFLTGVPVAFIPAGEPFSKTSGRGSRLLSRRRARSGARSAAGPDARSPRMDRA